MSSRARPYTYEIDLATMLDGVTRPRSGQKDVQEFLSVDPLTSSYPWYTPYQFAGNKPIWAVDIDGLEEFFVTRWNQDGFQVSQITLTVANNVSGGTSSVRGPLTGANQRVQYTNRATGQITYAASLSPAELQAIRSQTTGQTRPVGNTGGVTTLPGVYTATARVPLPPPPPPPVETASPVLVAEAETSEQITTNPTPVPSTAPVPTPIPTKVAKPKLITEEIDLGSVAFDGGSDNLDRYWGPTFGSDDITDLLTPAVNALRNDPNSTITINVGTPLRGPNSRVLRGKFRGQTGRQLLTARFNEVVGQMKEVDPNLDTSRVKRGNRYGSKIQFSGSFTTTKQESN